MNGFTNLCTMFNENLPNDGLIDVKYILKYKINNRFARKNIDYYYQKVIMEGNNKLNE